MEPNLIIAVQAYQNRYKRVFLYKSETAQAINKVVRKT